MDRSGSKRQLDWAPLVGALGCLQPGIDPVFLTLLTIAQGISPAAHGLIVGTTQAGAGIGAVIAWRAGAKLPLHTLPIAAAAALLCSIATTMAEGLPALLAARAGYGLAMGIIYTRTLAAYARRSAGRAYGTVFLIQLILAALVSWLLPLFAEATSPRLALLLLALCPASVLWIATRPSQSDPSPPDHKAARVPRGDRRGGWAFAAATFWFICATMLVWSFTGNMALAAGFDESTIGTAVALGSLAGAVTAATIIRRPPSLPLPATAVLAGIALATPILLIKPHAATAMLVSVILLNIGSTAIIVRCSEQAAAASGSRRFDAFVASTHPLGMIAGPLLGSVAIFGLGQSGLLVATILALSAGLLAALLGTSAIRTTTRYEDLHTNSRVALD